MKPDLDYCMIEMAIDLVDNYIYSLKSREPPCKYSSQKEYSEWSAAKSAAETILKRIVEGFKPTMVVEDYTLQMDYFSQVASDSGNYETSTIFGIQSDVAIDIMNIFHENEVYNKEICYE